MNVNGGRMHLEMSDYILCMITRFTGKVHDCTLT